MSVRRAPGQSGLEITVADLGRCRLQGNAHTFPGGISAWSEKLQRSVTISKSQITAASPEAEAWIAGFLAGNEPSLAAFLGVDATDAEEVPDDDPAVRRWMDALDDFRMVGRLPFSLNPRPSQPPPGPDARFQYWSLAGGMVWRWERGAWREQIPQPEIQFGALEGSECASRRHHEMNVDAGAYVACAECGYLVQIAGDD